jgi:hypothetical protein
MLKEHVMRNFISFVVATLLFAGGVYLAYAGITSGRNGADKLVIMGLFIGSVGSAWLWADIKRFMRRAP